MARPLEKLEAELLDLPPSERAHLAHLLLVSLDDDGEDDPEEVERAWEEEIKRRWAAVEAGTADLMDADEFFAELRNRPRP